MADSTAAATQKLLEAERQGHRAAKRAAKLAADQARGLKQALDAERQKTAAAEERARHFEVALFEERAWSAKALQEQRAECLEAAVEVARELAARRPQASAPGPGPPARRASSHATELARGAPSTWSEAGQRASVLGVGVLFRARQLRAHHGTILEGGHGGPLKETLTAIAHPYGGAPPLSPAEALPAALACVDFCVVALPALLDSAAAPPDDAGYLASIKSAASTAAASVASTVDQVLWEEENVDLSTLARPALQNQVDSMLAAGPLTPHKSEERDGTSL
jgi:hypothetical protein